MDVTTRNRTELKSYFVKNSIPTESNFAELIDGMLNQKDDGIVKLPGDPLNIEAAGADTSQKKLINFYRDFGESDPDWVLNLNPRSDLTDASTARLGFNISDGESNSRLFIDRTTGNIGIGTTNPSQKLDVAGGLQVTGAIVVTGAITAPEGPLRDDGGGWVRTYGDTGWYSQTHGGGWYMIDSGWIRSFNNKGIYQNEGILRTDGTLHVGDGGGTLNVANDGNFAYRTNVLFANTAGNVGIGTTEPGAKLDVHGQTILGSDKSSFWHHNPYDDAIGEPTASIGRLEVGGFDDGLGNVPAILRIHQWGTGAAEFYKPPGQTLILRETPGGGGSFFNKFSIMDCNVGIGTTGGAAKLAINGGLHVGGDSDPGDNNLLVDGIVTWGVYGSNTVHQDDAGLQGKSGFYEASTPSPAAHWYPGASSWQHLLEVRQSNGDLNYALQIAGSLYNQELYFRKINNDPATPWNKFVYQAPNGNVGIGTTNPATGKLQFSNELGDKIIVWDGGSGSSYGIGVNHSNLNAFIPTGSRFSIRTGGYDGAEHFVVTAAGNVGIGTVSPGAQLSISGASSQPVLNLANDFELRAADKVNLIRFGNDNSGDYQVLHKGSAAFGRHTLGIHVASPDAFAVFSTGLVSLLEVKGGSGDLFVKGNVGIGTTNPGAKLGVSGASATTAIETAEIVRLLRPGVYNVKNNNSAGFSVGAFEAGIGGSSRLDITLADGPVEANAYGSIPNVTVMSLLANGNVGIGTTAPANKLHIVGTGPVTIENAGEADILFKDTSNDQAWQVGTNAVGWYVFEGPLFHAGTQYRLVVKKGGNVGIGTTSPGAKLDVSDGEIMISTIGSTTPKGIVFVEGSNARDFEISYDGRGTGGNNRLDIKTGLGGGTILSLKGDGNVGIGTVSPGAKLAINGGLHVGGDSDPGDNNLLVDGIVIWGDSGSNTLSRNDAGLQGNSGAKSGFYQTASPSPAAHWYPGASSWQHLLEVRHSNSANNYALQIAGSFFNQELYFRKINNNPATPWNKFVYENSNGNVGIGTTSPTQGKLVVNGTGAAQSVSYGYLNRSGPTGTVRNQRISYSIWCSGRVAAVEFNAVSDGRIKNVIGVSDRRQDLEMLNQLQVTDYTFVDIVDKGNRPKKKLIAQQVQEVYPTAVSATENFIPDVYEMSLSTVYDAERKRLTITTAKAHGFAVGETVRIIDDIGAHEVEVLAVVDEHTFTVENDTASEKVFVYGKRVDDFLVLDYEAIAMLNVSATQELTKRIRAQQFQIERLEDKNTSLKAEMRRKMDGYAPVLQKLEALATSQVGWVEEPRIAT